MNNPTLATVSHDFYGQQIILAEQDGEQFALFGQLCSHMGIDAEGQRQALERQVWAQGMTFVTQVMLPGDSRPYPRFMVNVKILGMWLANVTTSRISDAHARLMVERYQVELTSKIHEWLTAPAAPAVEMTRLQILELAMESEHRAIAEGARADQAEAHVAAIHNNKGLAPRNFIRKYFPDAKETDIFNTFYAKQLLICDPRGRWSDVQQKRIPGATHMHPYAAGKRFFELAEEPDRDKNLHLKTKVRRDAELDLVQWIESQGFTSGIDCSELQRAVSP